MSAISRLLQGTRARGAFTLRAVMASPWSVRIAPESPLTLIAGVCRKFWVMQEGVAPFEMGPGDLLIARANVDFSIASEPDLKPDVTIYRGQDCRDEDGNSVSEQMSFGVRTWGNDPAGETVIAVAAYENFSETSDRLSAALPPVLRITNEEWQSPLLDVLIDEIARDEDGQAAVLDRLVDLLLTAALKAWVARAGEGASPDWHSDGDPVVTRALRYIYAEPAKAWTIETLAAECHVSRATLARRFRDIIGEPPISFLTRHRMAMAADLLQQRGETLASIAEKVGYQNAFAFSVAFKRARGMSPSAFRTATTDYLAAPQTAPL